MKRRYIGIEQLNYGENDSVVRLGKVIKGEQTGISKNLNWIGGGSFIFFELKKYNQLFIEKIENCYKTDELIKIWNEIKNRSFIKYNVDIKNKMN
jgi:adenine-specific DNA-methyltransferase